MAKTSSLKKLLSEIADLPEDKVQEAIDFVGYLKAKAKEAKSRKEAKLDLS